MSEIACRMEMLCIRSHKVPGIAGQLFAFWCAASCPAVLEQARECTGFCAVSADAFSLCSGPVCVFLVGASSRLNSAQKQMASWHKLQT
jgi:hypothetical protein